jgi:hypothetical protein
VGSSGFGNQEAEIDATSHTIAIPRKPSASIVLLVAVLMTVSSEKTPELATHAFTFGIPTIVLKVSLQCLEPQAVAASHFGFISG